MHHGLTLIEILITVAIMTALIVLGTSAFSRYSSTQLLSSDSARISALLADARAQTLASKDDTQYGVHLESDRAVLFAGDTYTAGAAGNRTLKLSAQVSLSEIALSGGATDVVFKRLTGATAESGTLTLTHGGSNETVVIRIDESGIAYVE